MVGSFLFYYNSKPMVNFEKGDMRHLYNSQIRRQIKNFSQSRAGAAYSSLDRIQKRLYNLSLILKFSGSFDWQMTIGGSWLRNVLRFLAASKSETTLPLTVFYNQCWLRRKRPRGLQSGDEGDSSRALLRRPVFLSVRKKKKTKKKRGDGVTFLTSRVKKNAIFCPSTWRVDNGSRGRNVRSRSRYLLSLAIPLQPFPQ